jgi:hypothetical protein
MTQQFIVIFMVLACVGWLGVLGYRFFKPKPGGKACGGGCCDGETPKQSTSTQGRTMMISSDDLRTRLKARKS